MGLIKPSLPDLDYDQWRSQPRREQVRAMVVHWAEQDLDASGATSRAERRTTPVNLRHQPTRSSEDRTVGWSQRRACYLTTEDQDLLAEHDDLDRQLVPFGTAQPAQPAQLKHPHEGHGQPDTRRTMPWPIFPLGWPSAKAQPEVLDGVLGTHTLDRVPRSTWVGQPAPTRLQVGGLDRVCGTHRLWINPERHYPAYRDTLDCRVLRGSMFQSHMT